VGEHGKVSATSCERKRIVDQSSQSLGKRQERAERFTREHATTEFGVVFLDQLSYESIRGNMANGSFTKRYSKKITVYTENGTSRSLLPAALDAGPNETPELTSR